MTLSLAQRKEIVAKIPWVTRLTKPRECQGFMSHTALKHVHGTPEQRAQKPKCKKLAHWKFNFSKRDKYRSADTEYYCWNHLFSRGLYGSMYEADRFKKWWIKHGDDFMTDSKS